MAAKGPTSGARKPAAPKPPVRSAKPAAPDATPAVPPPAMKEAPATPAEPVVPFANASGAPAELTQQAEAVVAAARTATEQGIDASAHAVERVADATPVEETVMNTTEAVDSAAANTQNFAGEINARAKTAFEKGAKGFEEMGDLARGNVEALVESGRIAAKGFETMGQDAAEFGRRSFEQATATLKTLASAKSPTEFFKLHSDYVRQQFDAMVAETSKNTESLLKLANDAAQPISNRVAVATDRLKVNA